jgi:hypothetical protein
LSIDPVNIPTCSCPSGAGPGTILIATPEAAARRDSLDRIFLPQPPPADVITTISAVSLRTDARLLVVDTRRATRSLYPGMSPIRRRSRATA